MPHHTTPQNPPSIPLGEITLPIHIQCLCFKTAVLMKDDDFITQMQGWMTGQTQWPAMDTYATWLNATRQTITTALTGELYQQLTLPLFRWLNGNENDLNAALDEEN